MLDILLWVLVDLSVEVLHLVVVDLLGILVDLLAVHHEEDLLFEDPPDALLDVGLIIVLVPPPVLHLPGALNTTSNCGSLSKTEIYR